MVIEARGEKVTTDTSIYGYQSLVENFKGVKPVLIKLDPGKKPEEDSVKIYDRDSYETSRHFRRWVEVDKGSGRIITGSAINDDPECVRNGIYWGESWSSLRANKQALQNQRRQMRERRSRSSSHAR